ncbi:hypothetical protein C8Q80DRAFT_812908 [Daedaleopsis nitida]|nr:hypothetical protein C8Q80DRAFT_812908 [Daedaleopsis nitida]
MAYKGVNCKIEFMILMLTAPASLICSNHIHTVTIGNPIQRSLSHYHDMAEVAIHPNNDMLNELLIAKLLEDDMRESENTRTAEELQLKEALASSALAAGRFPRKVNGGRQSGGFIVRDDQDVVFDILAAEINANKDAIMAQTLQHAEDSNMTASRQYAQRLAAAEKKCLLDAEFARRLQQSIDNGEDEDSDIDVRDAESVLGQDAIKTILASDLNEKGKGKLLSSQEKGKGRATAHLPVVKKEEDSGQPTCGICMEPFQATHSPQAASRCANSSSRLQFGTYLPCPHSHGYCHSCLSTYIKSKLDPDDTGIGSHSNVVFPIRCPECPIADWPQGIPDAIAERVLSEKAMILWHHQKLLDSAPRYYCPNPRCSALVQVDEESEEPQAICPSCNTVICVPCCVIWHDDLTCEEYQALPLDERSPDDQKALQLMKAQNWRRCPSCAVIVELTLGCNHITCRCKTEFCFKCGSLWDVRRSQCSREPSCELWDEELLLEERERQREREREQQHGHARLGGVQFRVVDDPPPPPYHPAPVRVDYHDYAPYHDEPYHDDLSWMDDPDVLCTRHAFTANMIDSLTCQYCQTRLNSVADLRYHLSQVRWHSVYACCGKFFKRDVDLERHLNAQFTRFGQHTYTVRRN